MDNVRRDDLTKGVAPMLAQRGRAPAGCVQLAAFRDLFPDGVDDSPASVAGYFQRARKEGLDIAAFFCALAAAIEADGSVPFATWLEPDWSALFIAYTTAQRMSLLGVTSEPDAVPMALTAMSGTEQPDSARKEGLLRLLQERAWKPTGMRALASARAARRLANDLDEDVSLVVMGQVAWLELQYRKHRGLA